jgi:hypothetical protein
VGLDGVEWSALRAARFTPVAHGVGGCGEEKNILPLMGMERRFPFRSAATVISILTWLFLLRLKMHGTVPPFLHTSL